MKSITPFTKRRCLIILLSVLMISGCSDGEKEEPVSDLSNNEADEANMKTEDRPKAADETPKWLLYPETIEDLVELPTGEFAGATFEENAEAIKEVLEGFPSLSEEASKKEKEAYLKKIVAMFTEDYSHPSTISDQWALTDLPPPPEIEDERYELKPNLNVEILLDASGSMVETVGDSTKMDLAKEAIQQFSNELPEAANVGLRVFGHKGTTAFDDKEASCQSSELVYEIQPYDGGQVDDALAAFEPSGWTPLALAIQDATNDLSEFDGETNTNILFIVSDGKGMCGGDPVAAAENLSSSNIQPIVNVIGFDVDQEGEEQLKEIAEATDGLYALVQHEEALEEQFQKAREIADRWEEWRKRATSYLVEENTGGSSLIAEYLDQMGDQTAQVAYDNIDFAIDYLYETSKIESAVSSDFNSWNTDRVVRILDIINAEVNHLYETKEDTFDSTWEEVYKKAGER
ncbi:VWA domain-containing protein [Aureibacillus halotolerans]|uniref:Ca-activated chloride channel family protein n=1 Tax=Aureibacillus halotolerans TaxID=1508390 RepID=A0A4R6TY57_9BACI|nr:VWA domain-containing protein [Aureibacillus halotolerans]TDQ37752.1 Ca-activated chloride channel family protein [Aureibacillus halotolerans]